MTGRHTTLKGIGEATASDDGRVVAADWKYDSLHRCMLVLKVEGHKINGNYEIIEDIENSKKDWYIFATKATFLF